MVRYCLILGFLSCAWASSQSSGGGETRILDLQHQSSVFGEIRHYRIFLPPDYDDNTTTRYPVIYFFHGWGERFNVGTREGAGAYDQGTDYSGDNIANFVKKNPVIVVKWDGYNPRTPDEKYLRPYNIGPVETYRQFPFYFPELVEFIDSTYRTIPDRDHRAVSGLSMGGFMAFWIAGKYPHLVGSVSNFMGSPEFVVGPRAFPSEYLHTDMFRNYEGVRTRLVMGSKDFIRWYHAQMNRIWDFARRDYEHETFEWDHGTPQMAKQLQFHMNAFAHPLPKPAIWHHIDVYPAFDVWGFSVSSDRYRPGFTVLENVQLSGFRSSVREWLWNGQTIPSVTLDVATDAAYKPNVAYHIVDLNLDTGAKADMVQKADPAGRLHVHLSGDSHEVGIVESSCPILALERFEIKNAAWATAGHDVALSVRVVNKGTASSRKIRATLSSPNPGIVLAGARASIRLLPAKEIGIATPEFHFRVEDPTRAIAGFELDLKDEAGRSWKIPFEVRLFEDVKELRDLETADGRRLRVMSGGKQAEEQLLGIGNGDGVVNPGESIVVLVRDEGELHAASLFSHDSCVNPSGLNLRFSDYWGDYDHVGGSAKYSMPTISARCEPGHEIVFFAEYLLPHAPEHVVRKGQVRLKVYGRDAIAPRALSADLAPGNILEVEVVEGGYVKKAAARIVQTQNPSFEITVPLNDSALSGDKAAGDNLFSGLVPEIPAGEYRVLVGLSDDAGNSGTDSFEGRIDTPSSGHVTYFRRVPVPGNQ